MVYVCCCVYGYNGCMAIWLYVYMYTCVFVFCVVCWLYFLLYILLLLVIPTGGAMSVVGAGAGATGKETGPFLLTYFFFCLYISMTPQIRLQRK